MSDISAWAEWIAQSVAQIIAERRCRPLATYRLQFTPGRMTFRDAARIVPYLDELGVSHLYASPYLKSRSGSSHGYAIVDYAHLNPELGTEADYRTMCKALHDHDMGQILDVVPNHMSAMPSENLWWTDVLENGPASPHAPYFDIDWHPIKEELRNKVLLPILGDQYGKVLESGELMLEHQGGAFFLRYYEWHLPIDPRTCRAILTHRLSVLKDDAQTAADELRELESIVTAIEHLPERWRTDPDIIAERQREKEVIKDRLRVLEEHSKTIAQFIRDNVKEFNGISGDPHSYDRLDELLDAQVYRLSHWKAAADEINYRRFFDINDLAAVCMESPAVFAESHSLIFELLVQRSVNGLRVDHIDGLYEPMEYLRRLQRGYLVALGKWGYQRETTACKHHKDFPIGIAPPWDDLESAYLPLVTSLVYTDRTAIPLYVVAEKILGTDEMLPEQWLLSGTTGYDFLNSVAGLFVDPAGLKEVTTIYQRFVDEHVDFHETVHRSKLLIFRSAMSSDLQLLAYRLNRISERHRRSRDFTFNSLRIALREILVCFPVYRTYIHDRFVAERDRQVICHAAAQAKRRNPTTNTAIFDFIRDVLLLEGPPDLDEAGQRERELFVGRVQQVTSPVMAKGVEDTAFYRYFPLASLNEVGADPVHGAATVDEFHRHNLTRLAAWPRSLICTSTHDTKRSEDTRARISVLSEIPHLWRKAVNRWSRLNRRHRREVDGQPAPSRNDEYLFYQSLIGVWPITPIGDKDLSALVDRLAGYMEKATREAKVRTSWINPNTEYDAAIRDFVQCALSHRGKNRFLEEFLRFHEQIANWGIYNALSQVVLKLTSPGVPDIYQGEEEWRFSLVDPDNRRSVDFSNYQKTLARLRKDVGRNDRSLLSVARALAQAPRDPRLKLFVTWRILQCRRQYPTLFQLGDYIPLSVEGAKAKHLCAFARQCGTAAEADRRVAIVIVPRLLAELTRSPAEDLSAPPLGPAIWQDTEIPMKAIGPIRLRDVLTGQIYDADHGVLRAAEALADFPVALFTNDVPL